jgi:sugar lactone lactonase YvrE
MIASVALDADDTLGEGPVWDDRAGRLLRVDIPAGRVHAWDPTTGEVETTELGGEVSAVVPLGDGDGWVVARGLELLRGSDVLARVQTHADRFNDCRCDPQGRLWAGTMSKAHAAGAAALYRVDPDGDVRVTVAETTLSNGLGWSPDGETLYFIDSTTQRVDAFDFDDGAVSGRRPLAEIAPDDGMPDGLCVDAEGGVWVALWDGSALRRYAPDGELTAEVALPVTKPTCPAFGGPDLDVLYVTSARIGLTDDQLGAEPAGAVLAVSPGVRGLPANRFG